MRLETLLYKLAADGVVTTERDPANATAEIATDEGATIADVSSKDQAPEEPARSAYPVTDIREEKVAVVDDAADLLSTRQTLMSIPLV